MSGSGGGFAAYKKTPEELARRIREAQSESQDEKFGQQVSAWLDELLAEVNPRDVDAIRAHLERVKRALETEIDGTVDLLFGGSVAKHTFADGISDVDALVLLDGSELAAMSPADVLAYFQRRLSKSLPETEIEVGRLAVTVRFSDEEEIQLLPAVRSGDHFKIADSTGEDWATVHPENFANELVRANREHDGKVVPVIKLAKIINAQLPENRQLKGYHIECLAVEAFKSYSDPKTTKAMLKHFFAEAAKRVMRPIADATGQSIAVDDYLGEANGPARVAISNNLARVSKTMQNADAAGSIDAWKYLFGEGP